MLCVPPTEDGIFEGIATWATLSLGPPLRGVAAPATPLYLGVGRLAGGAGRPLGLDLLPFLFFVCLFGCLFRCFC